MTIFSKEFAARIDWLQMIKVGDLYHEDEKKPKWFDFRPLRTPRLFPSTIEIQVYVNGEIVAQHEVEGLVSVVTGREFIDGKVMYAHGWDDKYSIVSVRDGSTITSTYPINLD